MGGVYLCKSSVLLVLVDVLGSRLLDSLEAVVHVLLLGIVDFGQLFDLLLLKSDFGLGLLHDLFAPLERFSELYELVEQLVMLLLLFSELVVEVFVQLLLRLLLLNQLLDLRVPVSLQLGNQPFLVRLLLGLELLLQILVGHIGLLLLLVELLLCLLQIVASVVQLLDPDVQEAVLDVHLLDLRGVPLRLRDESLKLAHGHVLLVGLLPLSLQSL